LTQLQDLLVTAPSELRESITAVTGAGKATQSARLRPDLHHLADPLQAAKMALRSLARRIADLNAEIRNLDHALDELVAATSPSLVSKLGIGTGNAGQLLVTAGQNITRLTSEAAFARLCGVAPIPVSSGKTNRMRLHRGGDRQANRALYMITVCRLRYDPRTIAYVQRRITEGKTKAEAIRCVKRFIAREVYQALKADLTPSAPTLRSFRQRPAAAGPTEPSTWSARSASEDERR
jgi:transposase